MWGKTAVSPESSASNRSDASALALLGTTRARKDPGLSDEGASDNRVRHRPELHPLRPGGRLQRKGGAAAETPMKPVRNDAMITAMLLQRGEVGVELIEELAPQVRLLFLVEPESIREIVFRPVKNPDLHLSRSATRRLVSARS